MPPPVYRVVLRPEAQAFVDASDRPLQAKLARRFAMRANDPRASNNAKPLTGPPRGLWRYRVGDHRVVYEIVDGNLVVNVIRICPRSSTHP